MHLSTYTPIPHGPHLLEAIITAPENTPDTPPSHLILHGFNAAAANGKFLAEYLANQGHASLRLSHSGHGNSTGHKLHSSLAQQLEEAKAALPYLSPPLTLVGTSMGAHTATLLTQHTATENLILIAPATYNSRLHATPFGPDFSFGTRLPGYWKDSPAWPALNTFTGNFLLITAGEDEAVPPATTRLWWQHARNARHRTHLHLPQSPHSIRTWLEQNPAYLPHLLNSFPKQKKS